MRHFSAPIPLAFFFSLCTSSASAQGDRKKTQEKKPLVEFSVLAQDTATGPGYRQLAKIGKEEQEAIERYAKEKRPVSEIVFLSSRLLTTSKEAIPGKTPNGDVFVMLGKDKYGSYCAFPLPSTGKVNAVKIWELRNRHGANDFSLCPQTNCEPTPRKPSETYYKKAAPNNSMYRFTDEDPKRTYAHGVVVEKAIIDDLASKYPYIRIQFMRDTANEITALVRALDSQYKVVDAAKAYVVSKDKLCPKICLYEADPLPTTSSRPGGGKK